MLAVYTLATISFVALNISLWAYMLQRGGIV